MKGFKMKTNKLIGILLFLVLSIISQAASYGFTPSPATVGEGYTIYANLDGDLPSEYDIRISGSSSSSAYSSELGGGPKNWYKYATPTVAGSATLYFKVYKNGVFYGNLISRTLTVNSNVPNINSVSVNPTSAVSGSTFTFSASLSASLPSGYYAKIDFGAGYQSMSCSGSSCSKSGVANSVGTNRSYTVKIVNSSGTTQGNTKSGTYTVEPTPETQYSPVVSVSSASSTVVEDSNYQIKLYLSDRNDNLKNVRIDWGDSSSDTWVNLSGGSTTQYINHTYSVPGNYQWDALVKDHTGRTDKTSARSVTVVANIPTINTPYVTPPSAVAGSEFDFYAPLSASLPNGHTVQIEFYDGSWKFRTEMDYENSTRYKLSSVISKAGTRYYRVAIFEGSTQKTDWVQKSFVATEPIINHAPVVSNYSASTVGTVGTSVTVRVRATDSDTNLGTVEINWGDEGSKAYTCSVYSGDIYQCTHSYQSAGNFTWGVTAYDNGNPNLTSNKVMGSIEVQSVVNNEAILSLLNQDNLIQKMNLEQNLDEHLSRSDAIVLIDRMRVLVKNGAEKNMEAYYKPFADVPGNAEYLPSLMRLAYYHSVSFDGNPINKYNTLFNPMRHMSREEFVAVAMTGFDIPKQDYDLSAFDDYIDGKTNMSDWAVRYFETAVYYGIINGNNGRLLARDRISIQEALWILDRIREKFSPNYPFDINSYDTPESLDISQLFHKSIGYEYEPRYYKPDATPIDITSITPSKTGNYYILTVVSTIDTANGARD